MKKSALLLLVCTSLIVALSLSSCDSTENHTHTFNTEWSYNDDIHWHGCTEEGCAEISENSVHSYGEWAVENDDNHEKLCLCGKKISEAHAWDDGVITTPATYEKDGVKTYTCTTCSHTKTEAIKFEINPLCPDANEWKSYFTHENVTVTSKQTDSSSVDESIIKIAGDKWIREINDISLHGKFYKECTIYNDGETTYIEGNPDNTGIVSKEAFFSFIDFADKFYLFYETEDGKYELVNDSMYLYGFTFTEVVITVENGRLQTIHMYSTFDIALDYEFFDWGTTVVNNPF